MKRWIWLVGVIAGGCVAMEPGGTSDFPPAVSLVQAIEQAAGEVPNGFVVEGELELAEVPSRYEIDVLEGFEVREVRIDPQTGGVLDIVSDTEGVDVLYRGAEILSMSSTTLETAIFVAEAKVDAVPVQVEVNHEERVIEVLLLDSDELVFVIAVDLTNGAVVSVGQGSPEENED